VITDRNTEVDTIRSFALFGIVVVNVPFFAMPLEQLMRPPPGLDAVVGYSVEVFFQGKFFLLFSFIFGWGFAVQMASAERRGRQFAKVFRRRIAALFFIGVAHAILVFHGDILVLYAGLGLALMAFQKATTRCLMAASATSLAGGAIVFAVLGEVVMGHDPATRSIPGYLGTLADATFQRLADWPDAFLFIMLFNGPLAFAAFLAGLAAHRCGFFEPQSAIYASLRRRVVWLLGIGLVFNIAYASAVSGQFGSTPLAAFAFAGLAIGGPCLSAVYLIAVIEFVRKTPVAPATIAAGKMSLTAYILEGILAGLVFNGYGLGLYSTVGMAGCFAIALGIFAATHAICAAWLATYQQGPVEALLRVMTYAGHAHRSP